MKLYGSSSESSFSIVTVAVLSPSALGSNVISNVVEPLEAIGVEGIAVKVKSPALAPVIDTYGEAAVKLKSADPKFSIVNVLA